jgi:hypothetical protein
MNEETRGTKLRGTAPKALLLNDGSRLALEGDDADGGTIAWKRAGDEAVSPEGITVAEALDLAGEEHRDYVATRTRAEAAWLRMVSDWYREQADRLSVDLAGAY